MDNKSIFIGFDYGTRNIGVAVGQKITKSASVLPPLVAKNANPPWDKIDDLVANWRPQALVMGIPCSAEGKELNVTKLAKSFGEELKNRYKLPVYTVGEHLTTKAARTKVFARGGYKALKEESIDSEAAKIILEEWMQK